ncbi:GDYXXLXY domain-containing protein [Halobacillus salinus]|uniref:GDYXXLXY domain-containing protein n=1 Tax=Halobacillus salinus TaxID=192814 RepID=UPI0009A8B549|nr:GDYXXLXY domain-containing protein [Halobacillus salinus]
MKKTLWFYVLVALQAAFLIVMSVGFYAMDEWGETINLKTEPVDPRDPFYGDYVVLNYQVESFPSSKWEGKDDVERGDKVYLLLENEEDGVSSLIKASDHPLNPDANQIVVESRMEWRDQYNDNYRVDLGLDRYYIEENTGREWEQAEDRIVTIVLAPWGQKKIQSVR